jgi:antitoxin HicB
MQTFSYPATVEEPYPADFVVSFVDVPEAISGGDTREEALANASEALEIAIEHYLTLGRPVPNPREAAKGEHPVALAPAVAARVLLTRAMADQQLTKVGLASRMNKDEKVVRRVLSGKGVSLELILEALVAVGVRPALAA